MGEHMSRWATGEQGASKGGGKTYLRLVAEFADKVPVLVLVPAAAAAHAARAQRLWHRCHAQGRAHCRELSPAQSASVCDAVELVRFLALSSFQQCPPRPRLSYPLLPLQHAQSARSTRAAKAKEGGTAGGLADAVLVRLRRGRARSLPRTLLFPAMPATSSPPYPLLPLQREQSPPISGVTFQTCADWRSRGGTSAPRVRARPGRCSACFSAGKRGGR